MKKIILIIGLSIVLNANILDTIKEGLNTGITYTKEKAEIAQVKAKILSLEVDIDRAYKIIGKKYVESQKNNSNCDIGVKDLIKQLEPLVKKKQILEQEILDIKKSYKPTQNINKEMDRLENK